MRIIASHGRRSMRYDHVLLDFRVFRYPAGDFELRIRTPQGIGGITGHRRASQGIVGHRGHRGLRPVRRVPSSRSSLSRRRAGSPRWTGYEPPHEPYTFLKPRREESSEQSSDEGGDVLVTNQASYTSAVASSAGRVLDMESRTPGGAVAAARTFTAWCRGTS